MIQGLDISLSELESAVIRLIDLPNFIGSPHASRRKHGEKAREIISPFFRAFMKEHDKAPILSESADPRYKLSGYKELLRKGEYERARTYAVYWLRELREERKLWEKPQEENPFAPTLFK